ncbi:hypothetical protein AURDEDRAFT_173594 [Auricularia subglabra TFB-10046 SS5]|uniref:Uncharacterized protein n=1 Tax=Auricularia subglabra (strain TFB-10046 / SS5) TaxID=717982 RepID=J0WVQ8_AURST|nr:hypothetical protein AURDEDRAFT_173594 [Auricularia subglabra TFB-10046 SS5]
MLSFKFGFLAALVLAASSVSAQTEEDRKWLESVGWDGTVTPLEEIGTVLWNQTYPDPDPEVEFLQKRATYKGIYICRDINWGEPCGYAQQPLNTCISLGADWWRKISSFGPDAGQKCYLYTSNRCKYFCYDGCDPQGNPPGAPDPCCTDNDPAHNPAFGPVRKPGVSTLAGWTDSKGRQWNDQVASWICYNES